MSITLAGITLPDDLEWSDQDGWCPVAQETTFTLAGRPVFWSMALAGGRPITLELTVEHAWISDSQRVGLQNLASQAAATFDLVYHGTTYPVIFRHHDPPALALQPIAPGMNQYVGTIKLQTI